MKLIKKGEGEPYETEGHFGVWSMRKLVAGKDSQRLIIGLSHFLPQGGVEMAPASSSERTYFILSGSILVKGKSEEYLLEPGDMLYIGPGEEREIQTQGAEPCTVLLSIAKLD